MKSDSQSNRFWKRIRSKVLLSDRWITVRADTCVTPENVTIEPYYVLEYPDWVHAVVTDQQGKILVVSQYRHAAERVCFELPGGNVEPGEDPDSAVRRELLEETGIKVEDCRKVGVYYPNPATHNNKVSVFLAERPSLVGAAREDPSEQIAWEFLTLEKIQQLITQGEFCQGLHIASLYLALRALQA